MNEERNEIRNLNHEYLKNKYILTGNPDICYSSYINNIKIDNLQSIISHKSRLFYYAIGKNTHPERSRIEMLNKIDFLLREE